jgi:hypothetical protein
MRAPKWAVRRVAKRGSWMRAPASMLRVCARWVKLAEPMRVRARRGRLFAAGVEDPRDEGGAGAAGGVEAVASADLAELVAVED